MIAEIGTCGDECTYEKVEEVKPAEEATLVEETVEESTVEEPVVEEQKAE